ncbi:MAG: class I SAM-dependent methyltransferase [Chloroflexota bacterium]
MIVQSGWQVGSLSVAEACDRYMMSTFGNAFGRALVEDAAPAVGERVLDLACGTAEVARAAARRVGPSGRVAALDLNAAMLAMAQAIPQTDGPPIEWHEASAMELPFEDGSFDLVCCHQGLQFFPDQPAALREVWRVLVPGGRIAFGLWRRLEHQPFYAALAQALDQYLGPQTSAGLRTAFVLGGAADLRALVSGADFQDVHVRLHSQLIRYPSLDEYVLGYLSGSPMAPAVAALDEATRQAMLGSIRASMAEYVDDDGMASPWESHVVTARA